ncbi:MAG: TonB-dependent receptor [Bacteroidales bacterium]|nr:TonB-dependent receptor [Bacteroidales bacterium]
MVSLDYEIPFAFSEQISGNFKLGGKIRQKSRSYDTRSYGSTLTVGNGKFLVNDIIAQNPDLDFTDPLSLVQTGIGLPVYNLFSDFSESIINNGYTLNGYIEPEYVKQIVHNLDLDEWKTDKGATNLFRRLGDDYSGTETTSAAYLMADLNITRFIKIIGGVRYENTKTEYTSWGTIFKNFQDITLDTLSKNKDLSIRENHHFLPMVNAKIMPFKWMDIRLAYTQSIARPQYTSFIPKYSIDTDNNLQNIGNPKLTPALSHNYDIYFSFNTPKLGLFTIGGFLKRIEGFEYSRKFNKNNPLAVSKLEEILEYNLPIDFNNFRDVECICY